MSGQRDNCRQDQGAGPVEGKPGYVPQRVHIVPYVRKCTTMGAHSTISQRVGHKRCTMYLSQKMYHNGCTLYCKSQDVLQEVHNVPKSENVPQWVHIVL